MRTTSTKLLQSSTAATVRPAMLWPSYRSLVVRATSKRLDLASNPLVIMQSRKRSVVRGAGVTVARGNGS